VIAESRSRISRVYFPHGGIISCVVELENGWAIETGMIGKDGVFGAAQALDSKVSLHKLVVQVPCVASVVNADHLKAVAQSSSDFLSLLIKYEQFCSAKCSRRRPATPSTMSNSACVSGSWGCTISPALNCRWHRTFWHRWWACSEQAWVALQNNCSRKDWSPIVGARWLFWTLISSSAARANVTRLFENYMRRSSGQRVRRHCEAIRAPAFSPRSSSCKRSYIHRHGAGWHERKVFDHTAADR